MDRDQTVPSGEAPRILPLECGKRISRDRTPGRVGRGLWSEKGGPSNGGAKNAAAYDGLDGRRALRLAAAANPRVDETLSDLCGVA